MQRYNPYLIQSLKRLRPGELLEIVGRVAVKLAGRSGGLSKEEVAGLVAEALREAGLDGHVGYVATTQYPLLLNDLRRLGLVYAGDPLQEWGRETPAQVTPLARRVADAISACLRHCARQSGERLCFRLGGALVIASILAGVVPVGSPRLREVLEWISRGRGVEELAKAIISELNVRGESRLREVLESMRALVDEAFEVLGKAVAGDQSCIPLLYLPLNIVAMRQSVQGGS